MKQNPPPMIQTSQRAITEENQGASDTYVLYYDFSTSVRSIKPHQVGLITPTVVFLKGTGHFWLLLKIIVKYKNLLGNQQWRAVEYKTL